MVEELKSIPTSECLKINTGSCDGCPVYSRAVIVSRGLEEGSVQALKQNCPEGAEMQPIPYNGWAARINGLPW